MIFNLEDFVLESNRIEGIHRPSTSCELTAHRKFLQLPFIGINDLVEMVAAIQAGAVPRFTQGRDVRVGSHVPPSGGPHVMAALQQLLKDVNSKAANPYDAHVAYETLHPFTDGNGRSGRALWLWHMGGIDKAPLGFLHHFYYQSLQNAR